MNPEPWFGSKHFARASDDLAVKSNPRCILSALYNPTITLPVRRSCDGLSEIWDMCDAAWGEGNQTQVASGLMGLRVRSTAIITAHHTYARHGGQRSTCRHYKRRNVLVSFRRKLATAPGKGKAPAFPSMTVSSSLGVDSLHAPAALSTLHVPFARDFVLRAQVNHVIVPPKEVSLSFRPRINNGHRDFCLDNVRREIKKKYIYFSYV